MELKTLYFNFDSPLPFFKLAAGCFIFVVTWRFSTTKVNRDCSLIAFVASGLINSEAFRRRVILLNISSQVCMVLLSTVPSSGPLVILSEPICYCTSETYLLRNLVTPWKPVWASIRVESISVWPCKWIPKLRKKCPRCVRNSIIPSKGVTRLTSPFSWISHMLCSSLTANTTKRHGKTGSKWIFTMQKRHFFSFLSQNNRVIIREASSFCFNFLLLCLLCVYFALYTLKKSPQAFIRLSVNIL